jgi:TolB-like protein
LKIRSVREARRSLGVNLVVTGTIQRGERTVRFNAALINAITERMLRTWGPSDISLDDSAAFQDRVVREIVEMLKIELQPETKQKLTAGGTQVREAYDF